MKLRILQTLRFMHLCATVCSEALSMAATLDIPLIAYPTLTEAAGLLGVSASTLSRRSDLEFERMGERDKRLPAGEVMRLAGVYRKRSLGEVAAELIAYARQHCASHAEDVQEQIELHFEQTPAPMLSGSGFLAEARRALPAELYEEVARVYRASHTVPPAALISAEG
jgi:hypothetical protein